MTVEDYKAKRRRERNLELKVYAGMGVLIFAICVGIYAIIQASQSYHCAARWEGTYDTKFTMSAGCRVNVDGKWFPEERVRAVN